MTYTSIFCKWKNGKKTTKVGYEYGLCPTTKDIQGIDMHRHILSLLQPLLSQCNMLELGELQSAEGWQRGGARLQTHLKKKHDWPQSAWSKLKWHGIDVDVEGRRSSQTTVWTKLMCIHILHAVISRYQAWPLQYHFCNRWWAIATCLNYQRTCNYRELKLHWMGLLRKEHSSVFKLGLSHGLLFPIFQSAVSLSQQTEASILHSAAPRAITFSQLNRDGPSERFESVGTLAYQGVISSWYTPAP